MLNETPEQQRARLNRIALYTPLCGTRLCPDCQKTMQVTDLIPLRNDRDVVERLLCSACHGRAVLEAKRNKILRQTQDAFNKLVTNVKKRANTANVCDFTDALIAKFGGVDGAAQFMFEQLQRAARDKPGGKNVLDGCAVLVKLLDASSARAPKFAPVGNLSDEDLCRVVSVAMLNHEEENEKRVSGDGV